MQEFINQIGVDWRLFLAQTVNFAILLVVLKVLLYKPVINIIKERKAKIEEGIAKAQEADTKLKEINVIASGKIRDAEEEALGVLRDTADRAKKVEADLLKIAKEKEKSLLKSAERAARAKAEEAQKQAREEAVALVRSALEKTCELDPAQIDDALISKAVSEVSKSQ